MKFPAGFHYKKASEPLYKTPKSIQETIEIMAVAENGIFERYLTITIERKNFEEAKAQFATLEATIHNPDIGWETADEYLSGNVRDKLKLSGGDIKEVQLIKLINRQLFSFFIIVSLWYNRDIKTEIWRDENQSYSTENIILSHKRGAYKYGIKTIALFSDGGKRTELHKSSRTIAYYPANAIQTNGGI